MAAAFARLFPQPLVAILLTILAFAALSGALLEQGLREITPGNFFLALLLVGAVTATYQFPIHLERSQKIEMTSIPLFLIAVLLPAVPLAATAAGIGILGGELLVRRRRGNLYSDAITAAGRWTIVVMAGCIVAHLSTSNSALLMVAGAGVLWLGDTLTCPLVIAPMTGDRPLRIMISNTRESAQIEGAQYFVGLLGAIAASVQIWALGLLLLPAALLYMAFKTIKEVQSSTRLFLESMADTVDLRDPYTGGHSRRVTEYTKNILDQMGLFGPEADLITMAARLHDIGKIGVPDSILNKKDRLDPDEWAIMQTHPDLGADLLARYSDFKRGVEIVRHHHESWDGTGYPGCLKETVIPFGARVVAVADSYDAMTTDRPYRPALSIEKAAAILQQGSGKQWDPQVVEAFLKTITLPVKQPISRLADLPEKLKGAYATAR